MTFTTKFLWLIVRHFLFFMVSYNIVTWDRVVLMVAMIAGFEVDFTWLLQEVMHERAFKVPCMIFFLCRPVSEPI